MAKAAANNPLVRGRLSTTSVAELLVFALERRLSGSFVFEAPVRGKSALVVAGGRVTKVHTAEPVAPLGRVLTRSGAIDDAALELGLRLARELEDRLGDTLVRLDKLRPDALDAALREQLGTRLCWLEQLPEESLYGFYADVDFLEDRPACGADPLALIWRCLQDRQAPHPREQVLLSALGDRPLVLRQNAVLGRITLSDGERTWLERARVCPLSLGALLSESGLEPARARRLIYALLILHWLEVAPERTSSVPAAAPPAAALPLAAIPRAGARPSAFPARATLLPGSPTSSGLSAAGSLPPSWLPPAGAPASVAPGSVTAGSAPVPRGSSTRPPGDRVEHALERASRLVRERTRAEGAAAAALAVERARELIERKQYAAAEPLAREACDADPGNPELMALHAWLRMLTGDLSTPALAAQIVAALDRAVMKAPESVPVRSYRGQVLKRLGRDEEAFRDFRFVARRAPEQLDAVREVRLHLMRARNKEKQSGVFSKLFR
jgi:tetratricopeptide (TPR) repeat protein